MLFPNLAHRSEGCRFTLAAISVYHSRNYLDAIMPLLESSLTREELEAKWQFYHDAQRRYRRRIDRVKGMRSPYRGRQSTRRPVWVVRKARVLARLSALHDAAYTEATRWGAAEWLVAMRMPESPAEIPMLPTLTNLLEGVK